MGVGGSDGSSLLERAGAWWQQASLLETGAACLCVVLILAHLVLRLAPSLEQFMFLVPGYVLTMPWQLLTSNLFDESTPNVLVSCSVILFSSVQLHTRWSVREGLRFMLVLCILQGLASWCGMVVLYVLFRESHFLFAHLGGCAGLLGGLAVALKQLQTMVESPPLLGGAAPPPARSEPVQFLLRHAPLLALGWTSLLLALTHAGPPDELLFSLHGILVSWTYLRYYQPLTDGVGDSREVFEFAALFPSPLRRPLRVVGGACFGFVSNCCCGLFPPSAMAWEHMHATPSVPLEATASVDTPLPSVTTQDPALAERRRQRARELLEERLAAKGSLGAAVSKEAPAAAEVPAAATATSR